MTEAIRFCQPQRDLAYAIGTDLTWQEGFDDHLPSHVRTDLVCAV